MEKVYLSDSGPKVSKAIYGFWRWQNEGDATITNIENTVNYCLELGINTFDHADYYGNHEIEKQFGKIIQNKSIQRKDVVLFSKCGSRKAKDGSFFYADNSRNYILDSLDQSLKNLQTDYLDVFLLNLFDPIANPEETANTLEYIITTGKAKHIGVANFSVHQHQLLVSHLNIPIVTNHIELNLTNISALEDGRLDYIKQQFGRPLVWSPLAGGNILQSDDFKDVIIREKLAEIGEKYNANIEQTAVAWLMQLETLPIIGSLSHERIKNVATASEIKMEREDWYAIYNTVKTNI